MRTWKRSVRVAEHGKAEGPMVLNPNGWKKVPVAGGCGRLDVVFDWVRAARFHGPTSPEAASHASMHHRTQAERSDSYGIERWLMLRLNSTGARPRFSEIISNDCQGMDLILEVFVY